VARPRKPQLTHLDTHVVCWLYEGRTELLSPAAKEAIERDWTRDPFDRLIAAQAALARARLLTRDDLLRRHFPSAFW